MHVAILPIISQIKNYDDRRFPIKRGHKSDLKSEYSNVIIRYCSNTLGIFGLKIHYGFDKEKDMEIFTLFPLTKLLRHTSLTENAKGFKSIYRR